MRKTHLHRGFSLLTLGIGLLTLFSCGANAMRKSPEGATEENKSFNELLLERDIARDRARNRLMEMSNPVGDTSVTVKIRRKGENTDADNRGEVIAEGKISKEEAEKGDWGAVYTKVKASNGSTTATRSSQPRRGRVFEMSEREHTAIWSLVGLAGLGLLGWWYSRRFQAI